MLAAAMVLTTVPSTALTVLATESTQGNGEQAEKNDELVTNPDAVNSDAAKSEGEDEESEEITLEDSDTENNEQITQEGESREKSEEEDAPKDNVPTEPQGNASEGNAAKAFNKAGTDFGAAENLNSVSILFRGKENGSGAEDFLDIETVAEIDRESGYEGSRTTNGNVVFLVKPKAGWHTPTVTWHYVKENGQDSAESVDILAGGKCTITRESFTGDLTVTVTAAKVKNTLKTDGSSLTTAYLLSDYEGKGTNPTPTLNSTGLVLPFEGLFNESAEPIRIAVPSVGKNDKIRVKIADGSVKDLTRTEDIVKIEGTDCVVFTFNPYEVDRDKAESKENTNSTVYTLSKDSTAGGLGLTINADASSETYYDIKLVEGKYFETSTEYEYKKLTADNGANAVAGLNKDNYQTTGSGNSAKKNLFVFAVVPKTDKGERVKITEVYAELVKTSPGTDVLQTIPAVELTYKDNQSDTETKPCYGIDLSKINDSLFTEAMTLKIKAKTAFVEESEYAKGFENHKIEFTGALDTVSIYAKSAAALVDGDLINTNALKKTLLRMMIHIFTLASIPKTGIRSAKVRITMLTETATARS